MPLLNFHRRRFSELNKGLLYFFFRLNILLQQKNKYNSAETNQKNKSTRYSPQDVLLDTDKQNGSLQRPSNH